MYKILIIIGFVIMSVSANENFYPKEPLLMSIEKEYICKKLNGEDITFNSENIQKIKIITNDRGPFKEDIFWKFEFTNGVCYFPSSEDKNGSFLEYFQKFKGFNNKKLIESMVSTENDVFLVWDKDKL